MCNNVILNYRIVKVKKMSKHSVIYDEVKSTIDDMEIPECLTRFTKSEANFIIGYAHAVTYNKIEELQKQIQLLINENIQLKNEINKFKRWFQQ